MQELYQVNVENAAGELVAIGPRACKEFCERFLMTINGQIALGKEKHFHNPFLARVITDDEVN